MVVREGRGWGMRAGGGGGGVGVNYNNLSKVSNKLILPEPQLCQNNVLVAGLVLYYTKLVSHYRHILADD